MRLLQECGLSKPEARAYEELVKLGTSTSGKIAKAAAIRTSHIYETLYGLVDKGLASYYITRNVKYFQAASPLRLMQLYEERQAHTQQIRVELNKKIQELTMFKELATDSNEIKIYEGLSGIKTSREGMLEALVKDDVYYVLGAPNIANKKLNAYFRDVHERRIQKKIRFKIIYNESAHEFALERKKDSLTEVRVINLDTPTEIAVYKETVQIVIFSRKPILIEITNNEIAQSFLEYFKAMWELAKELE